jgi:hypothetical protein
MIDKDSSRYVTKRFTLEVEVELYLEDLPEINRQEKENVDWIKRHLGDWVPDNLKRMNPRVIKIKSSIAERED